MEHKSPSIYSGSGYKLGINRNTLLTIIITTGVTVLICVCSLFFYCHKRQQGQKQRKMVQMKLLLAKSLAALSKIKAESGGDGQENRMQNKNRNDDTTTGGLAHFPSQKHWKHWEVSNVSMGTLEVLTESFHGKFLSSPNLHYLEFDLYRLLSLSSFHCWLLDSNLQ